MKKNIHRVSTKQHGSYSQVSFESETQPSRKLCVLVQCLARTCESPTIPQCDRCARFIVAATVKLLL